MTRQMQWRPNSNGSRRRTATARVRLCRHLAPARGEHGLPFGAQLVGRRGTDADLLAAARAVEQLLDFAPHYHNLGS